MKTNMIDSMKIMKTNIISNVVSKLFLLIAMIGFSFVFANAQDQTLSGTVFTESGQEVIPGVTVEIRQLRLKVDTDKNGEYKFTGLSNGTYRVITHIEGFADQGRNVVISGSSTTLDFKLSLTSLNAEVTVSATGEEESVFSSFSSVNSVGITRIAEKASTGLGDVLDNEAGVSKRGFGGTGSSRPIIRGFSGDRVMVLQDGVRNGSIASGSGDHGEPVAVASLERIEVIKGPATLLYGSSAVGGVVNTISGDRDHAHKGLRGYITGLGGTVDNEFGGAFGVEYGYKKTLSKFDFSSMREGDFTTPLGDVPNSGSRANDGTGSLGYFGKKGFIRGSVTLDRRRYGIPFAPLFESRELLSIVNGGADCFAVDCQFNIGVLQDTFANKLPSASGEQIDIDMRRNNYRFSGGFRDMSGFIESGDFSVDITDYQHQELEIDNGIDSVATTFENDVFSYRGVFRQINHKRLSGQFGVEGFRRSFLNTGAEQLVDGRVRKYNFSTFALEELKFDRLSIQFGARVENNRYRPTNMALRERSFTGFSGAIGTKFTAWNGGSFIANFSTSYRSPSLEELYNLGPHAGTVTFEIGNQNLTRERSNGIELSFRQQTSRLKFNGSFYYTDISNFVYLVPRDIDNDGQVDVDDGLPVGLYSQNDARFVGGDATFEFDVKDYFGTFVIADIVNAKLKRPDLSLPRITPPRLRIGVDLRYKGLSVRPEAVFVGKRGIGDIFSLETPTAGYGVVNINTVYAFSKKHSAHIFTFGLQNLGDKLYRSHSNFLKDIIPERGRGLKASYTVRFF